MRTLLIILVLAFPVLATANETITVTRADGGPIRIQREGYNDVNASSTLTRQFLAVNDEKLPISIVMPTGVSTDITDYKNYYYQADVSLNIKKPIQAFRLVFLLFDVFGDHTRTLSTQTIMDLEPGVHSFRSRWSIFSHEEFLAHGASIVYVDKIRTEDGHVIEGDHLTALEEAKKFTDEFTEKDLDPEKDEN